MKGGADRIELCSSLNEGGLTPSAGLMQATAQTGIPCHAMIRPHSGDFKYDPHEIGIMAQDISNAHLYNLSGVVFGIEDGSGNLDTKSLGCLMDEAKSLNTTLQRVVDRISNRLSAIHQAIELGFDRVLTSGGAQDANTAATEIAKIARHARDSIIFMPGSGINAKNVGNIAQVTTSKRMSCVLQYQARRALSQLIHRKVRPHHKPR